MPSACPPPSASTRLLTPLPEQWLTRVRAHDPNDWDLYALELLGGCAGTMAVSTVFSRAVEGDGVIEPWELPLANAVAAVLQAIDAFPRTHPDWTTPRVAPTAFPDTLRAAVDAVDAILAPRRARMHQSIVDLALAAAAHFDGDHNPPGVPLPPFEVTDALADEAYGLIGEKGRIWNDRYCGMHAQFDDSGAPLMPDEACELFVLLGDFTQAHVGVYRVGKAFGPRRRARRTLEAARAALAAFAERNPDMVD